MKDIRIAREVFQQRGHDPTENLRVSVRRDALVRIRNVRIAETFEQGTAIRDEIDLARR